VPTLLLYVLFLLSGAAGLIYELIWVRELTFVFGGTTYAITTVLVAFMAGLGLGSYLGGRLCHRIERPGRVYGTLEIAIGLYALAVPSLLSVAEPLYRWLYGPCASWPLLLNLVRFAVGALVLIVPTTCMGATLPVLVRYASLHGRALGRSVGYLYGINTFGAVLGTTLCGFWLIPAAGLLRATWLAATLNVIIGIIAVNLLHHPVRTTTPKKLPPRAGPPPELPELSGRVRQAVLAAFAASGFAAMVYQITWTRALVMSIGGSTYAFTCILAAFILGLALGSLAIARWVDRWKNPVLVFGTLELLIGLVAVVIVPIYGRVPLIAQSIINNFFQDYAKLMAWQFALIIAITLVPTLLMGAVFPLVTRTLAVAGEEAGAATGRAYAANTVGTIAGSFLAGFVLIRSGVLGVQNSIIAASLLNGVVGVGLILLARPAAGTQRLRRAAIPVALLILIPLIAIGAGRWDRQVMTAAPFMMRDTLSAARQIVYYAEGVDLTVSVEHPAEAPHLLTLRINSKPDASTGLGDMVTQVMLSHLPALVAPHLRTACMVGLGSGVSLGSLACYPSSSLERIDCVEISEDVARAAELFSQFNYNVLARDPRVRLILADGRNHLLLSDQSYDLIITQPPNPWMAGVASLFTREYFELGKRRLNEGGVMAAWLQGYKMTVPDFQMVIRTMLDVFEHVSLWELGRDDFLMLGSTSPPRIQLDEFTRRLEIPAVRADLYRVGARRPAHILGRYITSDGVLRQWTAGAPVHTDDNALLEFSAARCMYLSSRAVAEALAPLQQTPLKDLLAEGQQPSQELENDVGAVVASRWASLRADGLAARGDYVGALQLLMNRYLGNPDNLELYQFLIESRNSFQRTPQLARQPEIAAVLAEIDQLRPPLTVPLRSLSLTEIASALQAAAAREGAHGRWDLAAGLLREVCALQTHTSEAAATARALADALVRAGRPAEATEVLDQLLTRAPDDGAASYRRAVLAAQAGDPDTALKHLVTALKWGAVSAESLASDEGLAALRTDPRFQALITPSTAPAPE